MDQAVFQPFCCVTYVELRLYIYTYLIDREFIIAQN